MVVKAVPSADRAPIAFGPYRPPAKGPTGGLTPAQQQHLRAFIDRYTRRTAGSKEFTASNRAHLADPRSVAGFRQVWKEMVYPIVVNRSSGSRLWDVDGNEYIDLTNGFGMIFFGHNPDFIREAVKAQLDQGIEIGPQTPLAGEVARLVCEMTGMERAAFCNTGSEAVTAAIRVARTVSGRDKIAMFAGAYHGIFDEVLVRPTVVGGVLRSTPIAPGIAPNMADNVVVLEYGSPESLQTIKAMGRELAAVLVEPVQSRRPDLQPREFLHELRKITAETGTALVFDEVVTGFRIHPGGAQALFGVRADIATYGKVIGGGLPIGIVAGRSHLPGRARWRHVALRRRIPPRGRRDLLRGNVRAAPAGSRRGARRAAAPEGGGPRVAAHPQPAHDALRGHAERARREGPARRCASRISRRGSASTSRTICRLRRCSSPSCGGRGCTSGKAEPASSPSRIPTRTWSALSRPSRRRLRKCRRRTSCREAKSIRPSWCAQGPGSGGKACLVRA